MDSLLPKSKVCSKCGEEKLLDEFNRCKKGKYGRESQCKVCRQQYHRRYAQENKQKIIERQIEKIKYLTENDLLPKSKTCTKCGDEKLLEEFYKSKMGKYGRESHCKSCTKLYNMQRYKDNINRYGGGCIEKYQDGTTIYYKYAYGIVRYNKKHYQENKEKIIERSKQYRQKNKERRNERERNRRKNNEQLRIRIRLSNGLRNTLNNIGKTKNASILTYIGCSIEFMKEHLNSTKKPDWGDDLHIDHIIPSSLFDHTNEEEIKKCWNWRNLRYLPAEENKSKQDKLDMDLVKSYGIEDLLPVGVNK